MPLENALPDPVLAERAAGASAHWDTQEITGEDEKTEDAHQNSWDSNPQIFLIG